MIYTLTINPAIDKLIFLERFVRNQTNRSARTLETIGGKGTHVSLNLKILEQENQAILCVSGRAGDRLISMLHERGVKTETIQVDEVETRTNIIIVESSGDCTIVAEQGKPLAGIILDKVEDVLRKNVKGGDYLVLSGDASNCARNIYSGIIREFSAIGVRVFLDTSGPYLRESLREGPFLVKPNLDELSQICGKPLNIGRFSEIVEALDIFDDYPIEVVAVSLGESGSLIKRGDKILRAYPTRINVKNTVGCGDAYLAGLVYGFHNQMTLEDTLVFATAVSGATAAHESSVGFDVDEAERQKEMVRIDRILSTNQIPG